MTEDAGKNIELHLCLDVTQSFCKLWIWERDDWLTDKLQVNSGTKEGPYESVFLRGVPPPETEVLHTCNTGLQLFTGCSRVSQKSYFQQLC